MAHCSVCLVDSKNPPTSASQVAKDHRVVLSCSVLRMAGYRTQNQSHWDTEKKKGKKSEGVILAYFYKNTVAIDSAGVKMIQQKWRTKDSRAAPKLGKQLQQTLPSPW
nr:uncharacterized protein LOC109025966 isoform X1 [Gorilla gorilla gorilla]XP_055235903.1 uncharacterized protein LOC109025966 isoform X1 [Gorilla gorilla gorilla]XP_055235904.1 uncharacterized protein LOC109025966 isoform X1 [Gorilla gorilla gorilla]